MRTEAQNEPQGGTHVRQSKILLPELKENYFDDDSIVLLESMQDGVLYSNILLKLYLKSLKHGGRLQLDENIPYTAQMIAHHHPPADRHCGEGLANLPEAGPCGSAGQRHFFT